MGHEIDERTRLERGHLGGLGVGLMLVEDRQVVVLDRPEADIGQRGHASGRGSFAKRSTTDTPGNA
jgi:hypothetical protein